MYNSDLGKGQYIAFGRNATVGTTIEELISYDVAMDWNSILASAAAMDVSSSSAADAAAGTGAQKVRLFGVDTNYAYVTEDITMNGQTKVTGTQTFLRVFGAEVVQSGSGKTNAGDVHVVKTGTGGTYTAGVPGTLTSAVTKMLTGWGSSSNGMFTTPASQKWELSEILVSARAQAVTILVQVQDFANENSLKTVFPLEVAAGGTETFKPEIVISEKCDVRFRALAAGASGIVSVVAKFRQKF